MEAVIFDMDGVIVDTEDYWVESGYRVLEEALAEDAAERPFDPERFAGMDAHDEYDVLTGHDAVTVEVSREEYFALYEEHAREIYEDRAELMAGFVDLLAFLRDEGLKTGLVSGSYWVDLVLSRFGLEAAFDIVLSQGDCDMPSKPAPDMYRAAAERLGVAPDACVVIEDTEAGVAAARDAGMVVIGYGDTTGQDLSHADLVVHGPDALREELADRAARRDASSE